MLVLYYMHCAIWPDRRPDFGMLSGWTRLVIGMVITNRPTNPLTPCKA